MTDTRDGVVAGLIAYTLWGFLPIYFKIVSAVPPAEVLLHRIVWAVPFGALIVHLRRQWPEVRRALTHRDMLLLLGTSAFLIAINWYLYIFAVQTDRVFQASLGYYINPLIYVLVGVLFFGEALRRLQAAAVILAALGVLVLTISGGEFPVIALTLAVSFTIYGVIRKRVVIGGMPGLFIETILLVPIAGVWLAWLIRSNQSAFTAGDPGMMGLLLLAGPITVIPLLCFALAARRVSLTVLGFMQFLAPTLQFCVGLYYGEQLTVPHMICFACIWIAVILFSTDALRSRQPG
ncbi:MAG: EamA family transporter RarD [Woeseiaceae bacterium]|nr:EamA family transporter RarD [Woeseiaceae bacterium]